MHPYHVPMDRTSARLQDIGLAHDPNQPRGITPSSSRTRGAIATRALALGTALLTIAVTDSEADLRYEPVLEWNGPYFAPFQAQGVLLETDSPVVELPFQQPRSIAVRSHTGRDVVYVADSGNNRIQAFEVNATFATLSQDDLSYSAGAPVAGEFSDQILRVPEYQAVPTQWIVPMSEAVYIDGIAWRWVESLTGYSSTDYVYTVDFAATADQPQFEFPAGSLDAESVLEVRYVLSNLQDVGGGTEVFGIGDVDYGVRNAGTTPVKVQIDELSGGPTAWEEVKSIFVVPSVADSDVDHLFVVDAADQSSLTHEQIFSYFIDLDGNVTVGEAYGDELNGPYDATVLDLDSGAGASAWVDANTGPFDKTGYPFVTDANQVTGHDYEVTVATGVVTITDLTTGRVLVDAAAEAAFADPFLGIPGLSLALNGGPWGDGTTTVHTSAAYPGRFLVIADTGNDRLKIAGLPSGTTAAGSNWSGDWLPEDPRSVVVQPTGAGTVGAAADEDYRPMTPSTVPEDWTTWTLTAPLVEGSLRTITFDPDGTGSIWQRVDDITTAAPEDSVFQVNWETGMVRFGDSIHGALPPASTDFEFDYAVSADLVRYGSSGTGAGRFASPRGVSGLWNSTLGRFDVYVSDSANRRIQKIGFSPADTTLGRGHLVESVISWKAETAGAPELAYPQDLEAAVDGDGTVYVAVSDPGNHRVVIYRDPDAAQPDPSVGVFDAAIGQLGNQAGNFVTPVGVAFLDNGGDLDLYVADESRSIVAKYEEGPTPTITLLFTGESALPACFPPSSGYPIRFTTTYPPLGGWVDFYYDTKATYDPSTAKLAIAAGTVAPTATSAYWDFDATPGGNPGAGEYHLFARLKDASGSEVAWDETIEPNRICIDPNLIPALQLTDAIDGDQTLYLQNGLVRDVKLELIYPDSVIGVGFHGTYDPTLVQILGITRGTVWDGTGYTDVLFNAFVDSTAGVFQVSSTAQDAPSGLSGSGPYDVAILRLRARANAISATERFKDGTLALDATRCEIVDVDGGEPESWTTRDCNIRIAYLGDIATTGTGTEGTLPALQPRPDGRIDFDDQMAFTLGWNGVDFVRDRIADMGPATQDSPNLWPVPDAQWNVDDILVFTSQFSYFADAGWNSAGRIFDAGSLSSNEPRITAADVTGVASLVAEERQARLAKSASAVSVIVDELPNGLEVRVRLEDVTNVSGALLRLSFGAGDFSFVEAEAEDFLRGSDGQVLPLPVSGPDYHEIGISRLAPGNPAVSGSGDLAVFRLVQTADGPSPVQDGSLEFELRNPDNVAIQSGSVTVRWEDSGKGGPRTAPSSLYLAAPRPNPVTGPVSINFAVPESGTVKLSLYNVAGRRLRTLFHDEVEPGEFNLVWDGRDAGGNEVAAGRYYLQLESRGASKQREVLVIR